MLRHLNSISKRIPVYVIGKTLAGAHWTKTITVSGSKSSLSAMFQISNQENYWF